MRYPASEKLEIIRLVEQSHLGVGPLWTSWAFRRPPFIAGTIAFWPLATPVLRIATAAQAGCGTGSRMMSGGRSSILPWRRRNCRPGAVRFTDTRGYFVSEASVYRLLKAHDLITSPAFVVIKAADEFRDKTTAPNQLCRPTSPISRSSAGAGFTCRPSWTTIPATSLLGSSAPT